jgi:hypothetical protein
VEAIRNPDHDRHDEVTEWVGDEFDPEKFDLDAVNGGAAVDEDEVATEKAAVQRFA